MLSLIEDFLPVAAVGSESAREKSLWRGHPSTLHLWWARRPLIACRAAVYGALVPANRWVKEVNLKNPPADPEKAERVRNGKKLGLNRKAAAEFVTRLCQYPGEARLIAEAQKHILEAHAERLTRELVDGRASGKLPEWMAEFTFSGDTVTFDDIVAGRAPRPRVLDMFAGGGAIPLEALRLGCDAYANDLNPVAHMIEQCALVFPQAYGKPQSVCRGITGPRDTRGNHTWGGLAAEVRYWGNWVRKNARKEIAGLYPLIPDPDYRGKRPKQEVMMWDDEDEVIVPQGRLWPVAYLWTRTVRCKNPSCGAVVPLVKQTWLSKKTGRYVALKPIPQQDTKTVTFKLVEASTERGIGFDPDGFSRAGNAACLCCDAVADIDYVKEEGWQGRTGFQMLAAVCTRPKQRGKVFVDASSVPSPLPAFDRLPAHVSAFAKQTGISVPDELIAGFPDSSRENSLGITVRPYGLRRFGDLFTPRQQLCLLTFVATVHSALRAMQESYQDEGRTRAVGAYLATAIDRLAENMSSLCRWNANAEKMQGTFGRQVITMVWDFCEASPFGGAVGDWTSLIDLQVNAIEGAATTGDRPATVIRGSATSIPTAADFFDAVITDPPYYDNVPYADISDFFYVWLKRSVGHLFAEHFASQSTPKKKEAIADAKRHGGDWDAASKAYETMMSESFREACRVLKPGGCLVVVYAHKTTLGWSTLVDALRQAGFTVTEAWPLDTEMKSRLRGMESSALASSIFLVARKRDGAAVGKYEDEVRLELETIVRERVGTLWDMGISGADLVIACVGAGLRAFTRFTRVEYTNGEEVPAERFLAEVETVVLETILARLSKEVGGNGGKYSLAGLDTASRFYVLWRYTYGAAELDAGEAIIFANGTHVELDGQHGLTASGNALVEKKKSKYRLRDYAERGETEKLGLPTENGHPPPLIDMLHRTLWLMEKRPTELAAFLSKAQPNREQLRLVAQALAGPALKGGEMGDISPTAELSALGKLMANWQGLVEGAALTPWEKDDRKTGQRQLI